MNTEDLSIGTVGATNEAQQQPIYDFSTDSKLIKVTFLYPKDYSSQKFFKDGESAYVSPESADQFVELGIATKDGESAKEAKKK